MLRRPPRQPRSQLKQAESAVQSAATQLTKAQADQERARKLGGQAIANQPALALVDVASDWVHGFFREILIGRIEPGDRALITLMSYPISACLDLLRRPDPPEVLIIETSGVSDPAEVVRTFDEPLLQARLAIDNLIDAPRLRRVREPLRLIAPRSPVLKASHGRVPVELMLGTRTRSPPVSGHSWALRVAWISYPYPFIRWREPRPDWT